jgi:hypothetical protein
VLLDELAGHRVSLEMLRNTVGSLLFAHRTWAQCLANAAITSATHADPLADRHG